MSSSMLKRQHAPRVRFETSSFTSFGNCPQDLSVWGPQDYASFLGIPHISGLGLSSDSCVVLSAYAYARFSLVPRCFFVLSRDSESD